MAAVRARLLAQVTGADIPGAPPRTGRWDVHGTDLGHVFEHRGQLWMVFGDTFGPDRTHWRSNTMARVSLSRGGLAVDDMVADRRGRAREILRSRKGAGEVTVIPTAGVSTGSEMVLHYMSVREWGRPGHWTANHAGLAVSADCGGGRRWRSSRRARWPGVSNFVQLCFVVRGAEIFAFGIPAGRFGGAALARVATSALGDLAAWRYWDGGAWVDDHRAAALVVPPPVGELSVAWSDRLGCWLMLYLDEGRRAVVLRRSEHLVGTWQAPEPILTAEEYPTLYAPYFLPTAGPSAAGPSAAGPSARGDGSELYFSLSRFDLYNVLLFALSLP